MKLEKYRHPVLFYLVAVLVPWALWFIWGAVSHSARYDKLGWMAFGSVLGLAGLMAPMACALALILPDREMLLGAEHGSFAYIDGENAIEG